MTEDAQTLRTLLHVREQEMVELRREASTRTHEFIKQIGFLTQEVAKANDRIAELLVIVERRKKGNRKSKPKPVDPPDLTGEMKSAFDNRPTPPDERGKPHDHPRPRQRPTGRKPLPDHLPKDESVRAPVRCRCGCEDFDWVDVVVEEKLDIKAHQRRRVTHRKTGRCKSCMRRTTAEAPPSPFARSKVTCQWLAWFITQKFQLLTPLDRIRLQLHGQGVPLSMSFLVSQTAHATRLLEAIDGEHWKQLLAGNMLATDGTNLKVQIPKVGLHHGYIEAYLNRDIVVFHYEAEKGGETQAAKLQSFSGTLMVDAESRYNLTSASPNIREANCHAHPRRKLRDAEAVQPILAEEGGRYISELFAVDADGRDRGLRGTDLVAWRREHATPILKAFKIWSDAVYPTLLPDDPLAKIVRYYRKHWTELTVFLDEPVPLDNSAVERLFQPIAKMRLNSLFAGGTEGAHRSAVLFGIAATCKRLEVDFEAYLTWLFIRRGTHRKKYPMSIGELTPASYKATLSA